MQQSTASERATLSEQTFDRLRRIVCEHTGIRFPDEKRYLLESRVRPRLAACGMSTFERYVRYLETNGTDEIPHLINAVTINETSFFRHPAQFDALEQELLPELIRQRRREGTETVRLWSAACSTGDEAYSLAILIKARVKPRFPQMRFQIVATDIDTEALATARAGRYHERAVRNVPTAYLHRFFRRSGKTYILRSSVRDMVTFHPLNLVDEQDVGRMQNVDVVMCANVLIYFDDSKKQRVLHSLHQALRPGGYLFVGGPETLGETTVPFETVRDTGALVYRRPRLRSAASSS